MADPNGNSARADGMLLTILEMVHDGLKSTLGDDKAYELAADVVNKVRHCFGGELVYVCKGRTLDSIITSNKIWNEFTGNNHHELAKKYGFSTQWVYEVVRTMGKLKRAESQGDLFDGLEDDSNKD